MANCGKMQLLLCGGWWWQWQSVGLPQLSGDQLAPVTGDTGDWRLLSRVVLGGEGHNCRHYDIQDHLGLLQSLLCYMFYFSLL